MLLPANVAAVLDRFGVLPETKAALEEQYLSMGSDVFELFLDLADRVPSPSVILPEDLGSTREKIVAAYLSRSHPGWLAGTPTRSFWHPRAAEGRAAGLIAPLGRLGEGVSAFSEKVMSASRSIVGEAQPIPEGVLLFGKNAHFGGREETVSFDVVPLGLAEATTVALAEGRQHTVPGSVGETSGTIDAARSVLLLWEVQPNVLKPLGTRNRSINQLYRRHRNWHVVTLTAAILWAEARSIAVYAVRGQALAATHEVNDAQRISEEVAGLYDRTLERVSKGTGFRLLPVERRDQELLLESSAPNAGLRRRMEADGAQGSVWRLSRE